MRLVQSAHHIMERPSVGGSELRSVATQMENAHAKCNEALGALSTVAGYYEMLKEVGCGVGEDELNALQSMGERLMAVRQSGDNRKAALGHAIQQLEIAQFNAHGDLIRVYQNKFDQLQEEGANAVNEQTDNNYRTFLAAINKLDSNEEEEEEEEEEASSNDDGEEDVVPVAITYSRKDPISQSNIREPVKNRICGHAYDRASIAEFIQQQAQAGRPARCPHAGCPNKNALRIQDIQPFPEFFSVVK